MSSMEIARLCNKQHGHVMRDIRVTLQEAGIDEKGLSKFGSSYLNAQNKPQPCYFPLAEAGISVPKFGGTCNKRHDHVMRDIRTVLLAAGIGQRKFASSYFNEQNKE